MQPPTEGGNGHDTAGTKALHDDARLTHKIQLQQLTDTNGPIPHVALRKVRFLLLVALGVATTSAGLTVFLCGVIIERDILDAVGTTTHADARVELFQSIGGFVWAAVGLLLEEYFRLFLAAMLVYFANRTWYPGEVVQHGPGKFKTRALFWVTPLVMYVVNIGISSIFVEHQLARVARAFADDDLVSLSATAMASSSLSLSNASGIHTSVVDTVLRRLVTKGAVPFHINATSSCSSVKTNATATIKVTQNDTVMLPSMIDLQSTFVSFGFPARSWNVDALPTSLTPLHTVTVSRVKHDSVNRDEMQAKLDAFMQASGVTYATIGELLTQGQTLHTKATTDSNLFETYRCDPNVGAVEEFEDEGEEVDDDEGGSGSGDGSAVRDRSAFKARARGRAIAAKRESARRRTVAAQQASLRRRARAIKRRELVTKTLRRRLSNRKRASASVSASGDAEAADANADDEGSEPEEDEEDAEEEEEEEEEEDEYDDTKVVTDDAHVVNGMTVDHDGHPLCYGSYNYLEDMVDLRNATFQNVESVFESIYGFGGINFSAIHVTLDTFALSPQINVTTLTIDLPFNDAAEYVWVDRDRCHVENATFVDPEGERQEYVPENGQSFEEFQEYMCSGRYMAYDGPYQTCGERSCVIEDYSPVMFMTKQVQLTPYMTNCSLGVGNVTYDKDLSSWFPANCSARRDAAFLYGVGSYFDGDLAVRGGNMGPIITNPTRHYVLTFAKLEWQFEDLSVRFGAACHKNAGTCQGLLHPLDDVTVPASTNGSRVLIVGENAIPTTFKRRTLRNPLPLITLREPKLYDNAGAYTYYMYEYLDLARMNTTYNSADGLGLDQGQCSVYIDAYLNHVEQNHYYIQDPRQSLYTAALFYLFQDAQVKHVTLPVNAQDVDPRVIGTTRLTGDLETKEIRYAVPLFSVISTCVGMAVLMVYMAVILKFPRDAVKLSDETNVAAQFADVLVDEYPARVHTRRLRLTDGALIEIDDYDVQRIVFRNIHALDTPVIIDG